ncbi:MAG: hypothetical protein A3K00_05820 [Gallionellales bacterium RIFOXYD2_FULL_52_7]|nr:MAG: hypothetical protein A3K00_05820 [Gallionellales bacterium RIFOXYD2_FULL_52_7]
MAANQPVVANDTPENRAKNRRVSITILSPEFDRLADSAESLPAVEAAKPSDSAKSPAQVKPVVKAAPVVKN